MEQSKPSIWKIIKQSFQDFFPQNPFRHCAAIAYYTVFSLPGMAIIAVMVAGSFYEQDAVRTELLNQVRLLMGSSSSEQIQELMNKAVLAADSIVLKVIGIGTLVISATTVFASFQDSINAIWHIRPKPEKQIFNFLLNRLLSLAMIVSIGFLLLVSLMADTLIAILGDAVAILFTDLSLVLVMTINFLFSFTIITLVFMAIFKVLPDAQVRWGHVWKGAIITAVLFIGGKFIIGFYLSQSQIGDAYGAAGSLVALLTWVYYSVLIVLYGAQFTFTYNKLMGNTILPDKDAVAIRVEEIESKNKSVTEMDDKTSSPSTSR